MPSDDNIPRRGGRILLGHVRMSLDRQGMGLDRRRSSRDLGAATTSEPTAFPPPAIMLTHHFDPLRYVHAVILRPDRPTASTAKYDGSVRV